MPLAFIYCFLLFFLLGTGGPGRPLQIEDFNLGGDTYLTEDNCLRLTEARYFRAGSIWYKHPVDLNLPFAYNLKIMMGCEDLKGADGMVFVMNQQADITGYAGEGIGFAGLVPSLGIEIDTWRNYHLDDPAPDHVAIMLNGRVGHRRSLAGPKSIPNIEDCQRHGLVIKWDPTEQEIGLSIDGKEILTTNIDLINEVFGGNPTVYWGLTAATGKYVNIHEVCFPKPDPKWNAKMRY